MTGSAAVLAGEVTPFAAAALGAYGSAVLAKARDGLADATIGAGVRVVQRIFGHRQAGEELPTVLAEVIENPGDADYLAALQLVIRKALEADPVIRAEVAAILAEVSPVVSVTQHIAAGRDAYVAGRDMTIARRPD